eukprot:945759-Pleurochrysis_carterae.AAC.1
MLSICRALGTSSMHRVWWATARRALDGANAREVTAEIQVHSYPNGRKEAIALNAGKAQRLQSSYLPDQVHVRFEQLLRPIPIIFETHPKRKQTQRET